MRRRVDACLETAMAKNIMTSLCLPTTTRCPLLSYLDVKNQVIPAAQSHVRGVSRYRAVDESSFKMRRSRSGVFQRRFAPRSTISAAVTTLEDAERIARRVFKTDPITRD